MPRGAAAVMSSGVSPTTMSRATVEKYKAPAAIVTIAMPLQLLKPRPANIDMRRFSQLNPLRGMNVPACANFSKQVVVRRVIEIQNRERRSASLVPAQRHRCNVDTMLTEERADSADDSRTISIFENENDAVRSRFHRPAVHAHDSRCRAKKCTAH